MWATEIAPSSVGREMLSVCSLVPQCPGSLERRIWAADHQSSLQLGQEGKVPLQSAHMYYNVTEKVRRVMESYFRLDTPLYFSYSHLVCRTAIEGGPHFLQFLGSSLCPGAILDAEDMEKAGYGSFMPPGKSVQVCWLHPSVLNVAVACIKMQSTTEGSGSLPAEW